MLLIALAVLFSFCFTIRFGLCIVFSALNFVINLIFLRNLLIKLDKIW